MRGNSEPTRGEWRTFGDELYSFECWRGEQGLRSAGLRERRLERRSDAARSAAHHTAVTFPAPVGAPAHSSPTRDDDTEQRGLAPASLEQRLATQVSALQRELESLKALYEQPLLRLRDHHLPSIEKYTAAMAEHQQALARAQTRIERLEQRVGEEVTTAAHHLREVASIIRDLAAIRDAAAMTPPPTAPTESAVGPGAIGATGDVPVRQGFWRRRAVPHTTVLLSAALLAAMIAAASVAVSSRMRDFARRTAAAEQESRGARQDLITSSQALQQMGAEVLTSVTRMQRLTEVVVAPDVRRFALSGGNDAPKATGQALWSATRGIVIAATGLKAAPVKQTYQAWLVTDHGSSSLGLVAPDTDGRLTAVFDIPPAPVGTVLGAMLTSEPLGGSMTPGQQVALTP